MKVKAKTNGWNGKRFIKKGEVFESPILGRWMELIEEDKVEEVKVEKPKSTKPKTTRKTAKPKSSKKK
jgi:hypothetical protein